MAVKKTVFDLYAILENRFEDWYKKTETIFIKCSICVTYKPAQNRVVLITFQTASGRIIIFHFKPSRILIFILLLEHKLYGTENYLLES